MAESAHNTQEVLCSELAALLKVRTVAERMFTDTHGEKEWRAKLLEAIQESNRLEGERDVDVF